MKAIFTFLSTILTGCIAVSVPVEQAVLEGRRFSDSDIEFVKAGETTRGEIIASLGQPTIWLASQNTLVYGLRELEGTGTVWLVGTPGGSAGGLVAGERRQALVFSANDDDVVTHWGRTPVKRGKTWLQAALEWSMAKGLELPAPREIFSEESPASAMQGLVYFYGPRDFQHYLPFGPPAKRMPFGAVDFVNIYRNAELVGQLRWRSYVAVRVSPGEHTFVFSPDTDDVTNPQLYQDVSLQMTVEAGTARFVSVGVEAGKGTIEPILTERSRDEAMTEIRELRESW